MVDFVGTDGQRYLGGRASDSRELGLMVGFPPPVDKRVTFESGTFRDSPKNRWSMSHMRELVPTVNVWRGRGTPSHFEYRDRSSDIESLVFTDANGISRRFHEALVDTYADGIVVLHRGRIVYERYLGALEPHVPHSCMSITKSYAGTLAAALLHEGALDASKAIPHYVPELHGTAWADATLRQVMDMQTGLAFTEEYTGQHTDGWAFERAGGWRPWPVGQVDRQTMYDYLRTIRKEGEHGKVFAYKSVNAAVLAWVMARVTGQSLAQSIQERLWIPLGCEENGYMVVDSAGTPMAGGGLNMTLRDLARFGELMRREGEWNGKQLISASVVRDVHTGGDPSKFSDARRRGYSYRDMWWVTHNELEAIEGRGAEGQYLYIAPEAEMVVARFASQPSALYEACSKIYESQMLALGQMLRA